MIRLWAAAKSLQIPVKAGVLEAICLEQTWPLSLIEKLSASIFLSVQELVLHMFPPAPSLCHSFSCTHHHCQSSSLYTISLLFFICHSSFIFFFSSSTHLVLFIAPALSLPPGSQGKGKLSSPAEGAEPADWSSPQGARWNPRPLGPTWRGAPPQGRGAVGDTPAPVVTAAGNPGGVGSNTQIDFSFFIILITRILKYAAVFSNV